MRKIASPQELTQELRRLLAYAEGENPSREKLAAGLNGLAGRVAGTIDPTAKITQFTQDMAKAVNQYLYYIYDNADPSDVKRLAKAMADAAYNVWSRNRQKLDKARYIEIQATTKVARDDMFYDIVDERETINLYRKLEDVDEQAAKLMYECIREFRKKFTVDPNTQQALNRFQGMVAKGQSWDAGLLRNNVFKVADLLGLKLPSGMF